MDRVLCIAFCLIVIVVAVCVLSCYAEPSAEVLEPPTDTTTEVTTEVITETAIVVETPEVVLEATELEPLPTYTAEELEMMALVIYQEAGGDDCSNETRMMVGTVVMNRVADSRFPDSLYEVLTQEGQYGRLHWTGLVWAERASNPGEAHAVARAYECAERILSGERALPEDVIWQAEFPQGTETVVYQDGTYFCR